MVRRYGLVMFHCSNISMAQGPAWTVRSCCDKPDIPLTQVTGTKVQGFTKHEFSDPWVPPQLWVVSQVNNQIYTIQNANGRTFLDLRMLPLEATLGYCSLLTILHR